MLSITVQDAVCRFADRLNTVNRQSGVLVPVALIGLGKPRADLKKNLPYSPSRDGLFPRVVESVLDLTAG